MDLSGVFVPSVTPFDDAGEIDLDAFRANCRTWLEAGISGLVVGGTSGEAVLLDEDERFALWSVAREELGDRILIAGTGAESTRASVRLAMAAADAGADALLVQPPAFFKGAMSAAALDAHFREVADASPVPVIVYQVPLKCSTLDLPNDWVAEISHHPNVVGIKDSRGKLELVEELVQKCAPGFQVLVGSGAILYAGLQAGAVGGILGVANLMAEDCAEICRAFAAGDDARAEEVQRWVAPVHNTIVAVMGVPGLKAALDRMGMHGGRPRMPLHPLAAERVPELEAALTEAGIDTPRSAA